MGRILTFHGSDHKVGTSMLAQCFCEQLSSGCPQRRILLIHAENGAGAAYSPVVGESLDNIRPYLAERLVDVDSITEKARWRDNLFVIGGSSMPCDSAGIHPDMSQFFLNALRPAFDLIVCDSGSELENGLSLGALFAADDVYLILRQTESSLRRYEWLRAIYEKLQLQIRGFIVNGFDRRSPYAKAYLQERAQWPDASYYFVRRHASGEAAEIDGRCLLHYKDAGFRRDIDALCEALA